MTLNKHSRSRRTIANLCLYIDQVDSILHKISEDLKFEKVNIIVRRGD